MGLHEHGMVITAITRILVRLPTNVSKTHAFMTMVPSPLMDTTHCTIHPLRATTHLPARRLTHIRLITSHTTCPMGLHKHGMGITVTKPTRAYEPMLTCLASTIALVMPTRAK